jgi:hypothetical protein
MAELLIRLHPKWNQDTQLQHGSTHPGDVIAACDDNWRWSAAELTNPEWLIVCFPGVPVSAFQDMDRPLLDAEGVLLLKRQHHFEPEALRLISRQGARRVVLDAQRAAKLLAARKSKQVPGRIVLM